MRIFLRGFFSVFFVLLLLGRCFAAEENAKIPRDFLRYSVTAAMTDLDPQKGTSSGAFTLGEHLWEGLVRSSGEEILPGMAHRWTLSEEGLQYRFFLRPSFWSDGTPLTAGDFVYALQRLLDPERKNPYAFIAYGLKNARAYNHGKLKDFARVGVVAPDPLTLDFSLEERDGSFLSRLALLPFLPVPRHFDKTLSRDAYATSSRTMLFNGPFLMERWIPGEEILLRKNPDYWNASVVRLPGISMRVIKDPEKALKMFEAGELDFCHIPPSKYVSYLRRGKGELFLTGAVDWIRFNCRKRPGTPWGSNLNFRRALGYALDRGVFVEKTTQRLYFPHTRYVFPLLKGVHRPYRDEYPLTFYPLEGDPERARKYLAQALKEMDLESPRDILASFLIQDGEECRAMAEELKRQVESVLGISFTPVYVTRKERESREYSGNFDLVYGGWIPDYNDPMTYLEIWESHQRKNSGSYDNPEYDALLQAARHEENPQKRMDLLFRAEVLLLEDAPMIPLQLRRKAWICSPRVHNLTHSFIGTEFNFITTWIEP
ncbi:MAG TPA: peptide ABC transporter substrate-binding protein [Synergistaceae bacterium]|nr:peptide ABC transporter substrate-binding protein [Synergistaceae bacterium]HPQ37172.1 peptide ABC transporter substrate-binding protein [Synergistaceae bacterium]